MTVLPLPAQEIEVPRTRTFPGLEEAPYFYAEPEAVGVSSDKLDQLGNEIVTWVENGDLVGAELLIVKDRKVIFHETYGRSDRSSTQRET